MPSEEDDILSRGFDGEIPEAPLERRRKRPAPVPGGRDRRGRPARSRRLPALIGLAVFLHLLPVAAAWWARPELLGFASEGGTGWETAGIQWEGIEGLPPGPPVEVAAVSVPDPHLPEPSPEEAPALPSAAPPGDLPVLVDGGAGPAFAEAPGPLPEAAIPRRAAPAPRPGGGSSGPIRGEGDSLGSVGEGLGAVWNPRPAYPARARDLGQEGEVLLELAIGPDGRVLSVRVLRSSGWELLDRAAVDAVRRWRYAPGVRPAQVLRTLEVDFRLEDAR